MILLLMSGLSMIIWDWQWKNLGYFLTLIFCRNLQIAMYNVYIPETIEYHMKNTIMWKRFMFIFVN